MELYKLYNPITATPFACDETYAEYAPCEALKPYIKCFWGSRMPYRQEKTECPTKGIIIPDTCVDIIFNIDFTRNQIYSSFCGIDDASFLTHKTPEEGIVSTFAIRFYVWSVALFAEDSMKGTINGFFDADCYFSRLKRELMPLLFTVASMEERISIAQRLLLKHMRTRDINSVIRDAVGELLLEKGRVEIGQLSKEIHISTRQMERLFQEYMGISPKKLGELIRYQYLWHDIVYNPRFHVLDAVHKYGYTDQAHLLHQFKRFHTMTIPEARAYALKDVGFLQEKSCESGMLL